MACTQDSTVVRLSTKATKKSFTTIGLSKKQLAAFSTDNVVSLAPARQAKRDREMISIRLTRAEFNALIGRA